MNSIGQITSKAGPFFIEALAHLKNRVVPPSQADSGLSVQSYDNRGKLADFLSQMRSRMERLQAGLAANSFLAGSFSRNHKMASVSDRSKVLASASDSAAEKEYSLAVNRLARSRSFVSRTFDSAGTTDLEAGTYSFDLTVGSRSYSLDVTIDKNVAGPDSNRDVLRKIQSVIAGKDENVEAVISESTVKDFTPYGENVFKEVASLQVSSVAEGKDVSFALEDTSGNLIETLGLDKIRTYGRSSEYSLNSSRAASATNTLSLDENNLTAVLLGETAGSNVSIKVAGGVEAVEKELLSIIGDYNSFVEWIDGNRRFVSSRLKKDMLSGINSFAVRSRSLLPQDDSEITTGDLSSVLQVKKAADSLDLQFAEIGLTVNKDGRIDITDSFGATLVEDLETVHAAFAGEDGFFSRISSSIEILLSQGGSRYLEEKSQFLTYDAKGMSRDGIYRQGVTQLFNLYV